MTLRGKPQTEIQLSIVGYQFPEIEMDDYDANWLRMHLQVKEVESRAAQLILWRCIRARS